MCLHTGTVNGERSGVAVVPFLQTLSLNPGGYCRAFGKWEVLFESWEVFSRAHMGSMSFLVQE